MAYDEALADRVRGAVDRLPLDPTEVLTERKMFGGLCFLLNGKMTMGVSKSHVVLRLGTDELESALDSGRVQPMDFTGRPLSNFAYLAPEEYETDDRLLAWAARSLAYVREQAGAAATKARRRAR